MEMASEIISKTRAMPKIISPVKLQVDIDKEHTEHTQQQASDAKQLHGPGQ